MNGTARTTAAVLASLALLVTLAAAPAAAATGDGVAAGQDDGILGNETTNESDLLGGVGDTVDGATGGTDATGTVTDTVEGVAGDAGIAPDVGDGQPRLVRVGEDDLPVNLRVPALPTPVGTDDLPAGSGTLIGCSVPVEHDDVPTDALPGSDQLPDALRLGPIGPDTVAAIAVGAATTAPPEPCEVADPQNPPAEPDDGIDPDAWATGEVVHLDEEGEVLRLEGTGYGAADGDDGELGTVGILYLGREASGGTSRLVINDGNAPDREYDEIETLFVVRPREQTGTGEVDVFVFRDRYGGSLTCDAGDAATPDIGTVTDPGNVDLAGGSLGFCGYETVGVPQSPLTPQQIVTIVLGKITGQLPDGVGSLPVTAV